jgi:poly(3-hydroxybutyrate) depolymerase
MRLLARLATLLLPLLLCPLLMGARALPALQADLAQTTVSGLSSGAFMASQFAVIHSSIVKGVGIIAGGPYYCAGYPGRAPFIPYLTNALTVCENPSASEVEPPDAVVLFNRAQGFAAAGQIDPLANLRGQSVYLFSGRSDQTVTTAVVDQARHFYALAGTTRVRYRDDVDAGHGMVTDQRGDNACAVTAAPYFNNCQLALAAEILNFVYPGLKPPSTKLGGTLIRFDQRRFAAASSGMAADGYAYVPAACASQACRVHVAFHGCRQGVAAIGDHFYARAGYNLLADANNIVMLYPQVAPSAPFPYNPRGCWDFWGYASANPLQPDFFTRSGVQVRAVRAMLDRLAAPRSAPLRRAAVTK